MTENEEQKEQKEQKELEECRIWLKRNMPKDVTNQKRLQKVLNEMIENEEQKKSFDWLNLEEGRIRLERYTSKGVTNQKKLQKTLNDFRRRLEAVTPDCPDHKVLIKDILTLSPAVQLLIPEICQVIKEGRLSLDLDDSDALNENLLWSVLFDCIFGGFTHLSGEDRLKFLSSYDPDGVVGWNLIQIHFAMIQEKAEAEFLLLLDLQSEFEKQAPILLKQRKKDGQASAGVGAGSKEGDVVAGPWINPPMAKDVEIVVEYNAMRVAMVRETCKAIIDELKVRGGTGTSTDDNSDIPTRKLSPSRVKARAVYEYAWQEIEGAKTMTIRELFNAIITRLDALIVEATGDEEEKLKELRDSLPSNSETFGRYLHQAGIKRYSSKGDRMPGRSIHRQNED